MNNNYENQETECGVSLRSLAKKLMFLAIGGGIGAGLALLFAPKPGKEIREDIADLAGESCDNAIEAAKEMKQKTADLLETTLDTGSEILDVVSAGASEIKNEVASDVGKIGSIVKGARKAEFNYGRPGIF